MTENRKEAKSLTTRVQIDTAKPKARPISIGGNLYLVRLVDHVEAWLFIWKVAGGTGPPGSARPPTRGRKVTLVEAQVKARASPTIVDRGGDPREEEAKGERFADFAETMIANAGADVAQRPHRTRLAPLLAGPFRADRRSADSTPSAELSPRDQGFPRPDPVHAMGHRAQDATSPERVFLEAKAAGLRTGENPATREALGWAKAKRTKPSSTPAAAVRGGPAFFAALDMAVKGHAD